jgi:CPA2 family monovalent cation:H+ antiporter-2
MFELSALVESYNLKLVFLLAIGFCLASILGYLAWRIKLSPILGYLFAGYLIGPYSPGFIADMRISEQLAEIGVILMMFGVGLDFKLPDLMKVKNIAIPGALGQTLIAAILSGGIVYLFGWSMKTSIIFGLAISVASTIVLVRMLSENQLLKTQEGHIAVGWLIVEDIITVVILLLLPSLSTAFNSTEFSLYDLTITLAILLVKFVILAFLLMKFAKKIVSYLFSKVLRTHSHELFTLSILALIFLIAIGSTLLFSISIALGAFIAGMIVRQTEMHHKALVHSLPMKDAFIALFFLSVGMLFNPVVIIKNFPIFISILLIILIAKPVTAFLISIALKYPFKTALTVSAALAQIGEFSFILSEESMKFGFMSAEAYDIIVACALISIAVNPLIFKMLHRSK